METNLPSCFLIQFLEQLLKFLVNFTLLKQVKSQRSYGFLITKELIFGFEILDLVVRQLKYRLKMIIQSERFRESSCKYCTTAVVVEKNLAAFLACHRGSLRGKYYYLAW